ncbi:REG4 protein, partial [Crypturellus soui]|nr:REG4 protein [Crypturellus soui]
TDARALLHCPPGWSYYKLSCFKHFTELRSWDEAEAQCQASHPGAHLAWVQELREATTMRKVLSYYQRTQPVWIGLRLGHQGQGWRWVNGVEYSGASGIPRRGAGSGTCAALPNVGGECVPQRPAATSYRPHSRCLLSP